MALCDTINAGRGAPDHVSMDYSHGRIIKRSIWVTAADGIDFPHAAQVLRIRRDAYDLAGAAIAKEIVHGITSLDTIRGTPAALAALTRGQWGIELVHWLRSPGVPSLSHDVVPEALRRASATHFHGCRARCRCCSDARWFETGCLVQHLWCDYLVLINHSRPAPIGSVLSPLLGGLGGVARVAVEGRRNWVTSAYEARIGLLTARARPPLLLVHGGMRLLERWEPIRGAAD